MLFPQIKSQLNTQLIQREKLRNVKKKGFMYKDSTAQHNCLSLISYKLSKVDKN